MGRQRDRYGPCGHKDDHGGMQGIRSGHLDRQEICIRLGHGCDGDGHVAYFDDRQRNSLSQLEW